MVSAAKWTPERGFFKMFYCPVKALLYYIVFITFATFLMPIWLPALFIYGALEALIIFPQIVFFVYIWRKWSKMFKKSTTNQTKQSK